MKKLLLLVAAISSLAFMGCSKNDDESDEILKEQLVGTWERTAVSESGEYVSITIKQLAIFNTDNTSCVLIRTYLNGSLMQNKSFEYTYICKAGGMLYMTGKDSGTTQAFHVSITGKTMSMTGDDGTLTYTKQ